LKPLPLGGGAFTSNGAYLGLYGTTGGNGEVAFDLPAGKEFKFRADVLHNRYYSGVVTIVSGGENTYTIDCGGGELRVKVDNGDGAELEGVRVYLFSEDGGYLGQYGVTGDGGEYGFMVSSGGYKVRVDYLGYRFWSDVVWVSGDGTLLVSIPHREVRVKVEGDYSGDKVPKEQVDVYLFTPEGAYLGVHGETDADGETSFLVPSRDILGSNTSAMCSTGKTQV